jgi:hypothetical protein
LAGGENNTITELVFCHVTDNREKVSVYLTCCANTESRTFNNSLWLKLGQRGEDAGQCPGRINISLLPDTEVVKDFSKQRRHYIFASS